MILARAGTKSNFILLTIMFVATFASMWLSNVAAPVLCYSVIQVCIHLIFCIHIRSPYCARWNLAIVLLALWFWESRLLVCLLAFVDVTDYV